MYNTISEYSRDEKETKTSSLKQNKSCVPFHELREMASTPNFEIKRSSLEVRDTDMGHKRSLKRRRSSEENIDVASALDIIVRAAEDPSKYTIAVQLLYQLAKMHLSLSTSLAFLDAIRSLVLKLFSLSYGTEGIQSMVEATTLVVEYTEEVLSSTVLSQNFDPENSVVSEVSTYQINTWKSTLKLLAKFNVEGESKLDVNKRIQGLSSLRKDLEIALKIRIGNSGQIWHFADRISFLVYCFGYSLCQELDARSLAIALSILRTLDHLRTGLSQYDKEKLRTWHQNLKNKLKTKQATMSMCAPRTMHK